MPGVIHPSPGYPSFKYLQVQALEPNHKIVYKVNFIQHMVTIPQCIEESQPEELEKWLNKLAGSSNKEVYVGFPFPHEAFAMYFEDKFTIYTLFGDVATNKFSIMKDKQFRGEAEWSSLIFKTVANLAEQGVYIPTSKVNVLVTCNRVEGVQFDFESSSYYKTYQDKPDMIPLSLLIRKRDAAHPMNCLNVRVGEFPERELKAN